MLVHLIYMLIKFWDSVENLVHLNFKIVYIKKYLKLKLYYYNISDKKYENLFEYERFYCPPV